MGGALEVGTPWLL